MKGLLYKDIILCWNRRNFFLLITAISIMLAVTSKNPMFVISYITLVFGMFSISSISYDEFDNGNAFLFTLPFTRAGYVLEKYLFSLLISGIPWLISSVLITFYQKSRVPELDTAKWFLTTFIFLYMVILFLSLTLPLHLKYGAEKARLFLFGVMGVIFVVCILLTKITSSVTDKILNFLKNFSALSISQMVLAGGVFSIVLLIISGFCSLKVIKEKEF